MITQAFLFLACQVILSSGSENQPVFQPLSHGGSSGFFP
jgi:hypothetical protein